MEAINPTVVLAALAALVFLGMALEEVFRRTGIPDVLILLALGLVAQLTGLVDISRLQGLGQVFTTSALVLILFEGAMRLKLSQLREALGGSTLITAAGFFITVAGVAVLGSVLFGMRPLAAVLLGCVVGGTSSAVVIPMVGALPLNRRTRTVLTLESALTDVLCIVFTLALTGAMTAGALEWSRVGKDLAYGFGMALVIGAAAGFAWATVLRHLRKRRMSILFVAAAVFLVYAAAEALGTFGAIACLAFGVVLGNAEDFARGKPYAAEVGIFEGERFFLSEVAFLLKVFFFVYLGASLRLDGYEPFVFGGLVTLAIFAIRPVAVRLSFPARSTPREDAVLAAMLAPRGLAAAVLATVPLQAGLAEGQLIRSITYGVVLFSIVLTSLLTLFSRAGFVSNAYRPLFGRFTGQRDEALPAGEGAEGAPGSAEGAAPGTSGSSTQAA